MADLSPGAITRKARTKGGVVTIVTVLAMVVAMGLTWFGLSAGDHVSAGYDSSSWMWSLTRGELARVNGLTGKVDTRSQALSASQGHYVQVSQSDRFLIMRDQNTGRISALDPATLQITAAQDSQAGLGVQVALHNESAFIVDPVQGVVRQLDAATLQPIGEPLRYPPGITGGYFDGTGRLWIAVPSQGTVSAITPAKPAPASGGTGGGSGPSLVRTEPVAEAFHDLALSALDDGVAVLDQTNGTLTTLRGKELRKVDVTRAAGGELPTRSSGAEVPITVTEGRHVYVIDGEKVSEFTVPGAGARLRPAVAWAGRFYVADDDSGKVYALDRDGALVDTIEFRSPGGALELEVRENHLFINAPGSATARVVDDKHRVKVVDKFAKDVTGSEPPPELPPPPPPAPTIGKPGAPRNVTAASGDTQVRLSWGKAPENGSKITKYVVEGDGRTWTVGARQRSLVIDKLVNGKTYTFEVHAVNGKGAGPSRKSNPVMPTGEVPDAPTGVKAVEKPDGTVEVTWTAANGQGRKISRYEVTAVNAGSGALAGTTATTKLVVKAGELEYGTQYAFTVVAVNDKGAGSEVSQPSGTVVPFTKPDQVRSLSASTVAGAKGSIKVDWAAPSDNGRPITGYQVTAKGKTQTVNGTGATLDGFGDGEIVSVDVAAVNEAGPGPKDTTSAKTIADAKVSGVTGSAVGYKNFTVKFAYDDGGGTATCTLTINGAARNVGCNTGAGGYVVDEVATDTRYQFTVTVTNATGAAAVSPAVAVTTRQLNGTVRCVNGDSYIDCSSGVGVYTNSRQQSSEAVGDAYNGTTYKAFCWKQGTKGNQQGSAELFAAKYNNNKRSDKWVQITFRGAQRYIPFIWFNLDDGDSLGNLPEC